MNQRPRPGCASPPSGNRHKGAPYGAPFFIDIRWSGRGRAWASECDDWYAHQHRNSAIRFAIPAERQCGQAEAICPHRASIYASRIISMALQVEPFYELPVSA